MMAKPCAGGTSRFRRISLWCILFTSLTSCWGIHLFLSGKLAKGPTPLPLNTARKQPRESSLPWFADETGRAGVRFSYRNGEEAYQYTILESVGGGVALLDYDGDGLLDLFVTGGGYFGGPLNQDIRGHPCKLFRNQGHWKFQDVTAEVGLSRSWFYNHGAAVADYDRDGWPDLLVTGYGQVALFHNEADGRGGRRFVDVTARVGLQDTLWSTSAGWGDLDGDGWPDLYICHYTDWSFDNNPICPGLVPGAQREVCPPQRFKPQVHSLFHNDRGASFTNVSASHGFDAAGCGMGVVLADVNDDSQPDVYVANDAANNFLFVNRKGKLEEKACLAGVAGDESGSYNGSMGVDVGDYDGSGRASLLVTNFQGEVHALYCNLGGELFQHQSRPVGLIRIGLTYVGFGTAFVDVDNDGWLDLAIANGHVLRRPGGGSTLEQKPLLLSNTGQSGRRIFEDVSRHAGPYFHEPVVGRGLAVGDLDNDGWPDLVISHNNTPVILLRNQVRENRPANWLGVKLVGDKGRDVVGSTVILQTNTRRLTRFVKGGGSYLSASDSRLLFGLGPTEKVQRIVVKWSWGQVQSWDSLTPNHYWVLRETQSNPSRLESVP